jgi:hypothetical protein
MLDERDQHHNEAQTYAEAMLGLRFILPWPILYETLCTRFVRRPLTIRKFEFFLKRPNAVLLDDASYREAALEATLSSAGRRYSMVDNVLRLVLEDTNIRVKYLFSFNRADFFDICTNRHIEMI